MMGDNTPVRHVGLGHFEVSDVERAYVNQALDNNRLSYGRFSRAFEERFAEAHGCRHAVFCNSGTSALHMALTAMKEQFGWSDGDEVIVPALTFIASSNIVLYSGLRPVFCDVDPTTYNMDPYDLPKRLSARTRAVLPVHLFGQPCDMGPILDVCRQHSLRVLEDSCETMFVKYRGQSVGSFGDAAAFSTYMAHLLVTGVGGLVTTNDDDLAVISRSLMQHGRDEIYLSIDDDDVRDDARFREIVQRRFSFIRLGFSYRATELEAAIGLGQLDRREDVIGTRQRNAAKLTELLKPLEDRLQLPEIAPERDHAFMMYPLVCRQNNVRDSLLMCLERAGIETRHLMPLLGQPIYRKLFGDVESEYPVAKRLAANGFYVGCHQGLVDEDLAYLASRMTGFFNGD